MDATVTPATPATPIADENAAPFPINVLIRVARDVNEKHPITDLDPLGRGLTALESLWDQGYVIVKSGHHLRDQFARAMPPFAAGMIAQSVFQTWLMTGVFAAAVWVLAAATGWLLRGLAGGLVKP